MTRPSTTQFFDAAQWVYRDDPTLPDSLSQLIGRTGQTVTGSVAKDGFFGAAFETSGGQIIVSFEGTDLGGLQSKPGFVNAQLGADLQIYHGENPAAYTDALRFTRRVLAVAAAEGISRDDVFVDGHSLGGAEAEYVAAKTGLGGDTFGAPGIPSSDIVAANSSRLIDYVDSGDPVGNYSSNPNHEGNVLASNDIERVGSVSYVGDASAAAALKTAGRLYGTSTIGDTAALGILAQATVDHHLLQDYAADLNITPAAPSPDWMSNISVSQLGQLLAGLVGGQTGAGASLSALGQGGSLTDDIAGLAQAIGGGDLTSLLQSSGLETRDATTAVSAGAATHVTDPKHAFKLLG